MPIPGSARELALAALTDNPLVYFSPENLGRLNDPEFDVTFDELEMDSLGRMELSIWLELELGLELTDVEIQNIASLNGLARFLGEKMDSAPGAK